MAFFVLSFVGFTFTSSSRSLVRFGRSCFLSVSSSFFDGAALTGCFAAAAAMASGPAALLAGATRVLAPACLKQESRPMPMSCYAKRCPELPMVSGMLVPTPREPTSLSGAVCSDHLQR